MGCSSTGADKKREGSVRSYDIVILSDMSDRNLVNYKPHQPPFIPLQHDTSIIRALLDAVQKNLKNKLVFNDRVSFIVPHQIGQEQSGGMILKVGQMKNEDGTPVYGVEPIQQYFGLACNDYMREITEEYKKGMSNTDPFGADVISAVNSIDEYSQNTGQVKEPVSKLLVILTDGVFVCNKKSYFNSNYYMTTDDVKKLSAMDSVNWKKYFELHKLYSKNPGLLAGYKVMICGVNGIFDPQMNPGELNFIKQYLRDWLNSLGAPDDKILLTEYQTPLAITVSKVEAFLQSQ